MTETPHFKRILSLFLTLVMVLGMLPTAAFAAQDETVTPDVLLTAPAAAEPAPVYDFGPEGYVGHLIPGIYDLTVQMKKADNHSKDSMAAGVIKASTLEVMNSGDAYVNMKLGSHTMMGLTAFASDWQIFNEHNITSAATAAEIVTKDGKGNVTEIRFKLPYTNQAGVYARMHVQAGLINMNPEALLKMLFHQAKHNSAAEAAKIDAMIAALGDVTLADEAAVIEARKACDWLVPESRKLVKNEAALTAAEGKLAELKQAELDKAAAAAVDAQIAALGDITLEDESAILEARAAYNALNEQAKGYVQNEAALTSAEQALAALKAQAEQEAADRAAAAAVDAQINAIGEVSIASESAIQAARSAYNALNDQAKTYVQ